MSETVGQRVRRLRLARGLNMSELAAAAGLSCPGLSRIESGERGVSLEAMRALAAPLAVSADYLEFGVDEVVVRAPVDRVDAAAEQFGVPLGWHDLNDDERRRVLSGLDVALIDSLVAGLYAVHANRRLAAAGGPR